MKTRHVARHLFQGESGYFARMSVPHALRPIIDKKEFWAPVHANSDAGALRKLPAIVTAMQAEIDAARAEAQAGRIQASPPRRGRSLSPRQLAVTHYDAQMAYDTELRNGEDHDLYSRGFVDDRYVEALRDVISGRANAQETLDTFGGIVSKYQRNGHLNAEAGTPAWREAVRALAVAELESLARSAERDDGDFDGKPTNPLLTEKPPVEKSALAARMLSPDSAKPLSEIVKLFSKDRGASQQTNYESELTARMFEEYLGEAKPVFAITRQDVHGFKRALQELPVSATKRFPGLRLPDAIKANAARATPFPALNPRTIDDKYLAKLHSIFEWCVKSDVLPDNPSSGIKVGAKEKAKPPRVNFSPSDLTKIFSVERFDKRKPFREQQWAELCALFSGARAAELAQIKLDSVRHERGVLVAAIEEETKNAGSQRIVPIHSTLISLGLEKHVARLRKSGASHLFPEWYRKGMDAKRRAETGGKVTVNHHFAKFIPRRFNTTLLPKIGIHDDTKTWHSFRHTFKTGLARAGVPRSMQDDLCGHTDNSAGAGYVHGESVEAMKEAIEKLRFDGFTLTA